MSGKPGPGAAPMMACVPVAALPAGEVVDHATVTRCALCGTGVWISPPAQVIASREKLTIACGNCAMDAGAEILEHPGMTASFDARHGPGTFDLARDTIHAFYRNRFQPPAGGQR